MTHALRLLSIFRAAFMLTHSVALHCEKSAVSCWQRCPANHLVSKNVDPHA